MIHFVIISLDLRQYALDIRSKRGAELSTDLVVSWIRLWEKMLEWKPVSQMVDSRGEVSSEAEVWSQLTVRRCRTQICQ